MHDFDVTLSRDGKEPETYRVRASDPASAKKRAKGLGSAVGARKVSVLSCEPAPSASGDFATLTGLSLSVPALDLLTGLRERRYALLADRLLRVAYRAPYDDPTGLRSEREPESFERFRELERAGLLAIERTSGAVTVYRAR